MSLRQPILAGVTATVLASPLFGQLDALRRLAGGESAPQKQIAYFEIDGAITESPIGIPPLFGSEPPLSMKGLLTALKDARTDPQVAAIVLDVERAQLGWGQIDELHASLRKFAAVDKDVFVHADSLSTPTYALATAASHVSIVPTGEIWLTGLYGETPYLRGMLDKIGCEPDIEHCGDFKTAGEPIMRTEPSSESKEMTKWLLDGIYAGLVQRIADGRSMTTARVRELIDDGPYNADEAKALGLIDAVQHRQKFVSSLKKRYGKSVDIVSDYGQEDPFEIPDDNIFAAFEFLMKMLSPTPRVYTDPSIAIVYVEGTIQTGEAEPSPFGPAEGAFSTTIRRALDKAAEDDSVKAVVLRVDSPGGSALASEIILHATSRVAARKPLVVSMGNVAGSGGYYVTCAADTIFADENTITASIGVLGGKIVTTGMWDKVGINWHSVQRGKMAGLLSTSQKFTDEEREKIMKYMVSIYEVFKNHVVEARGSKLTKPIEEIAAGRVFTGKQALELGLVDKIGGLEEAIRFAAREARVGDYELRVIPEPANIFNMFMPMNEEESIRLAARSAGWSILRHPAVAAGLPALANADPLRFRAVVQALQRIQLIHDEGVVAMMPWDVIVR